MKEKKWFYFKFWDGTAVAKVDSQFIADKMHFMAFKPCSYFEYLRVMKQVQERDHDIEIQAVTDEE